MSDTTTINSVVVCGLPHRMESGTLRLFVILDQHLKARVATQDHFIPTGTVRQVIRYNGED